jgi:hypothetical protein
VSSEKNPERFMEIKIIINSKFGSKEGPKKETRRSIDRGILP